MKSESDDFTDDDEEVASGDEVGIYEGGQDIEEEEILADEDTGIPAGAYELFQQRPDTLHSPIKWEHLARWSDDRPFVGYRCEQHFSDAYRHTSFQTFVRDMYTRIGSSPQDTHPWKPIDEASNTIRTKMQGIFLDWHRIRGYFKSDGETTLREAKKVVEISKTMLGLLPTSELGVHLP
ncbi:hypothetical protein N0V83_010171 [Neocucurbitaria cava]|uniref:Uncharacterized protein n=1 Tax=Neocucurbitaria cava TaxID=798079 RepID=A0A9W8XZ52_9PLEO|nr:hypothetical protein N0V83_010171 [Neocucurbitaria cava]